MGLDIGGFTQKPDWPKMGPSLLIATSLILAIRTAKWPTDTKSRQCNTQLDDEVAFAAHLAGAVMSLLITHKPDLFPHTDKPWFVPNDEDVPG